MVAQLRSAGLTVLAALAAGAVLAGCGSPQGQDLEKAEQQPAADLNAGAQAQTIDQWSAANPNNGAPGSGEQAGK